MRGRRPGFSEKSIFLFFQNNIKTDFGEGVCEGAVQTGIEGEEEEGLAFCGLPAIVFCSHLYL